MADAKAIALCQMLSLVQKLKLLKTCEIKNDSKSTIELFHAKMALKNGHRFGHFAKAMAERNGQKLIVLMYEKFNNINRKRKRKNNRSRGS